MYHHTSGDVLPCTLSTLPKINSMKYLTWVHIPTEEQLPLKKNFGLNLRDSPDSLDPHEHAVA